MWCESGDDNMNVDFGQMWGHKWENEREIECGSIVVRMGPSLSMFVCACCEHNISIFVCDRCKNYDDVDIEKKGHTEIYTIEEQPFLAPTSFEKWDKYMSGQGVRMRSMQTHKRIYSHTERENDTHTHVRTRKHNNAFTHPDPITIRRFIFPVKHYLFLVCIYLA